MMYVNYTNPNVTLLSNPSGLVKYGDNLPAKPWHLTANRPLLSLEGLAKDRVLRLPELQM